MFSILTGWLPVLLSHPVTRSLFHSSYQIIQVISPYFSLPITSFQWDLTSLLIRGKPKLFVVTSLLSQNKTLTTHVPDCIFPVSFLLWASLSQHHTLSGSLLFSSDTFSFTLVLQHVKIFAIFKDNSRNKLSESPDMCLSPPPSPRRLLHTILYTFCLWFLVVVFPSPTQF